MFRDEIRTLAGRRFDQSCRELELRECRLQLLFEIGAQRTAPVGILAFGLIADPAIEFGKKLAGMKMLVRAVDSVGSGHVSLSGSQTCSSPASVSGYGGRLKCALRRAFAFAIFPATAIQSAIAGRSRASMASWTAAF